MAGMNPGKAANKISGISGGLKNRKSDKGKEFELQ
jgi:hypothetical protein